MSGNRKNKRPTVLFIESKSDGAKLVRKIIILYIIFVFIVYFANLKANYIENIFRFFGFILIFIMILISVIIIRLRNIGSKLFKDMINIRSGILINPINSSILTILVFIIGPVLITFDIDIIRYLGSNIFLLLMILVHIFSLSLLPEVVFGMRSIMKTKPNDGDEN